MSRYVAAGPTHNSAERGLGGAPTEPVEMDQQTIDAPERDDHLGLDPTFRIRPAVGLPAEAVFSRDPSGPLSTQVHPGESGR